MTSSARDTFLNWLGFAIVAVFLLAVVGACGVPFALRACQSQSDHMPRVR